MREVVGSQDQTSASYGGFNKILLLICMVLIFLESKTNSLLISPLILTFPEIIKFSASFLEQKP